MVRVKVWSKRFWGQGWRDIQCQGFKVGGGVKVGGLGVGVRGQVGLLGGEVGDKKRI